MTLTQIAKAFRNAIRDSAAIESQCVAYFGKGHSVWYGGGDTSSPLQDNCPAFIIVPESKNPSQIDSQLQFSVKVTLAILEPDPTVIDNSTEYLGSEYLESLLDLAY
jgi:hypothetical protein